MSDYNLCLDVQAELIGAAALFTQDEFDFSYINIIPGISGGAVIYALNGHMAFIAYDESGHVSKPIRISQNKDMLKLCGNKIDKLKKRVQADCDFRSLWVFSDKDQHKVFFDPSPVLTAGTLVGFQAFVEFHADSLVDGVKAKSINGNNFATVKKIFHYEGAFCPVLNQKSEDETSPIYMTLPLAKHILIVSMPIKLSDEEFSDHYGSFSDLVNGQLLSAPHAGGFSA